METQKQKVILVTGASQGLGLAICTELANAGHKVVGVARKPLSPHPLFTYLQCDVSNEKSVEELALQVNPDVIVSAAAICETDNNPYNHEIVRKTMEINFFGTMNLVNVFKNTEHFIVLSSLSAFKPNLRSVSYSASKAAVAMAFRGLAMNSQDKNFSTIYLGPVNTSMWEGKKSWIVAEPYEIAQEISKLIKHPRKVVYIPFISTTLARLSLLIPDSLYAWISKTLFK